MINAIVAVDTNWGIGRTNKETGQGELLFRLPKDLAWFKLKTLHKAVVMGYTTYLSLPEKNSPLPDRLNIVLWDQAASLDCLPGCITFNDFNTCLNFIKTLSPEMDVYISGGASIYNLFLGHCDRIYVTKVFTVGRDATVFFPNLDENKNFRIIDAYSSVLDGKNDDYVTRIFVYERIK